METTEGTRLPALVAASRSLAELLEKDERARALVEADELGSTIGRLGQREVDLRDRATQDTSVGVGDDTTLVPTQDRIRAEIRSETTSAATLATSRSSGEPNPPPPAIWSSSIVPERLSGPSVPVI